ncbi:MAG: hypothetical protein M1457_07925 [bacterium]|nr:hypothetical protein [bacterium]
MQPRRVPTRKGVGDGASFFLKLLNSQRPGAMIRTDSQEFNVCVWNAREKNIRSTWMRYAGGGHMVLPSNDPQIEELTNARHTLNTYDSFLSVLVDIATQKVNDKDYDPSHALVDVLTRVVAAEKDQAAIANAEAMCGYRFDFRNVKKGIGLLLSENEKLNYDGIRAAFKKLRDILRKAEEDTGQKQRDRLLMKKHGIY